MRKGCFQNENLYHPTIFRAVTLAVDQTSVADHANLSRTVQQDVLFMGTGWYTLLNLPALYLVLV